MPSMATARVRRRRLIIAIAVTAIANPAIAARVEVIIRAAVNMMMAPPKNSAAPDRLRGCAIRSPTARAAII